MTPEEIKALKDELSYLRTWIWEFTPEDKEKARVRMEEIRKALSE